MPDRLVYMVVERPEDGAWLCEIYALPLYSWVATKAHTNKEEAERDGEEWGAESLMDDEDDLILHDLSIESCPCDTCMMHAVLATSRK